MSASLAEAPIYVIPTKGWYRCQGRVCVLEHGFQFYSETEPVKDDLGRTLCPSCAAAAEAEVEAHRLEMAQLGRDMDLLAEERAEHEAGCINCVNGNTGPIFERRVRCASYPV